MLARAITSFMVIVAGAMITAHAAARTELPSEHLPADCVGDFAGRSPTPKALRKVVEEHAEWAEATGIQIVKDGMHPESQLNRRRKESRRANLCNANLQGADLRDARLERANLAGANLKGATLTNAQALRSATRRTQAEIYGEMLLGRPKIKGPFLAQVDLNRADLSGVNLTGAVMISANLQAARLSETNLTLSNFMLADLRDAVLFKANLSGAWIYRADLRGAMLHGANLENTWLDESDIRGASLVRVNLTNTSFSGADLDGTVLSLSSDVISLDFRNWQSPRNLARAVIEIKENASTLGTFQVLREDLKRAGLRDEERALTAAIQRALAKLNNTGERSFKLVFFDLPSAYGAEPGRCIQILLVGIMLFSLPYLIALRGDGKSGGGIWRVWHKDRLLHSPPSRNEHEDQERLSALPTGQALGYAVYFSVLSAFHFGWRDLNVGHWIARIQPREYALRASGWVRVVSGLQSLASIYLVALWVLTYFGRPFG